VNVSLIIAAGGAGKRFLKGKHKRSPGKLFFRLGGKPVLAHALQSFKGIPQIREIILAVRPGTEKWVKSEVINGYSGPKVRLVRGGRTRADSVRNALVRTSPKNGWVLVHDGARPFPPKDSIRGLFNKCSDTEAVILAHPVIPTLKRVAPENGRILGTVDRSGLFEAETPQLVRRSFLLKAYKNNPKASSATDESSLVESLGGRVKVLAHSGWNVKVTTPEDLQLAEAYYSSKNPSLPTLGFGKDTHRLVSGRKFYLGGVRIPFEKGALGHSDGDALLHAVSDAILGAAGLGDIGEWFSDKNPRNKNIRSEKILRKVLEEARKKGRKPSHVDTLIILEKPRLGPYKKVIQRKMAGLLNLPKDAVSIKAKTMEGLGPEGEGRAVTCEALVTLIQVPQ